MRDCCKKFLLNQFHDILPGSHINPVYQDAMQDYGELESRLDALLDEGGERFFNTLNQRKGVRGYYTNPEMDALSGKTLCWDGDTDPSWLHMEGLRVETPVYRIRFGADGSIESLFDKRMDREWTDGNFNKLHLYQDTPGMYDAWDILPNYKDVEYAFAVEEGLHFTYGDGQVAEFTARLRTPKEKSAWQMIIRLFRDSPAIEVEHIVDWDEKHRMVKAEFACNVLSRELVCDTSAGYIKRENHRNTSWQKARFEVWHRDHQRGQVRSGRGGEGHVPEPDPLEYPP